MKQKDLFIKTLREAPAEEEATNAKLLIRAGFIFKNSAGVYSYLPLGLRILNKITGIIREEINAIGGQELLMPSLVEKKYLEPTNRWDLDMGYFAKTKSETEAGFVLGWSHEEVLTYIASKYISSYKDLPFSAYQIQTKFRHEARAKSGLLRGREFIMKDLYSFHSSEEDFKAYYDKVAEAYHKIFERCGLNAIYTIAGGGVFTDEFTHEFQVISDVGEDTIYINENEGRAVNKEVYNDEALKTLGWSNIELVEKKSIEVGNIFDNGTRYSKALGLNFKDENGVNQDVFMGSYGIGISRLMGTIVEVSHDEKGLIWPESIAPFKVHLIELKEGLGESVYEKLQSKGIEVLYDNRDLKAGEKFNDADLIGIPYRAVVSEKTAGKIELKKRGEEEAKLMTQEELIEKLL